MSQRDMFGLPHMGTPIATYFTPNPKTPNSSITSANIFNFDTKEFDFEGCVQIGAAWNFKPRVEGFYLFTGVITFQGASYTAGDLAAVALWKNGIEYQRNRYVVWTGATSASFGINFTLGAYLGPNDYADIRFANAQSTQSSSNTFENKLHIFRLDSPGRN